MMQSKNRIISNTQWNTLGNNTVIDIGKTNVFRTSVDLYYKLIKNLYKEVLSNAELAKAARYVHSKDRDIYIVKRHVLRSILSLFINTEPSKIQFFQHNNKKPYVEGIEFNMTQSGNYVLISICKTPIGIDVEYINENFDFEPLIINCFNDHERTYINDSQNRRLNFYNLWTRKEAILKASGEGLIDQLNQLDVLPELVVRANTNYYFSTFLVDHNYVATLALTHKNSVNYWEYSFL